MMEEKNLHGPTRRYTNAAWRFYARGKIGDPSVQAIHEAIHQV